MDWIVRFQSKLKNKLEKEFMIDLIFGKCQLYYSGIKCGSIKQKLSELWRFEKYFDNFVEVIDFF